MNCNTGKPVGKDLYQKAKIQFERRNYEKAKSILIEFLQEDPENVPALVMMAEACCRLDLDYEAENYINSVFLSEHNNYRAKLIQGKIFEKRSDYAAAHASYTFAITQNPNLETGFRERSACSIRLGNLEDARVDSLVATMLNPKDNKSWIILGRILSLQKKHSEALVAYEHALELDTSNIYIHHFCANEFFSLKLFEFALFHAKQSTKMFPYEESGWLMQSRIYLQKNLPDLALTCLSEAESLVFDTSVILYEKFKIYKDLHETDKAIEILESLLEKDPDNILFQYEKFDLTKSGKKDEIVPFFSGLIEQNPIEMWNYLKMGLAQWFCRDLNSAIETLDKGIANCANSDRLWEIKGYVLFELKKFSEGVSILKKIESDMEEEDSAYLNNLGYGLSKLEKYDEALQIIDKGLQIWDEDPSLLKNKGYIYHKLGKNDEAPEYLKQAILNGVPVAEYWYYLGEVNSQTGDLKSAVSCYKTSLKIEPGYEESVKAISDILELKGATRFLKQEISLTSENIDEALAVSKEIDSLGLHKEAEIILKSALEIGSENSQLYSCLGEVLENLGDEENKEDYYTEALGCYEEAIRIEPDNLGYCVRLGIILDNLKRFEEAVKILEEVLSIEPLDAGANSGLAWAYSWLEDYEKGLSYAKRATLLDCYHPGAWNNLGLNFSCSNDHKAALECFQKALSLDPWFDVALHNVINEYAILGMWDEIQLLATEMFFYHPYDPVICKSLGLADYNKGKPISAQHWFDCSLKFHPDDHECMFFKSQCLLIGNFRKEALELIDKAISICSLPQYHLHQAFILFTMDRIRESLESILIIADNESMTSDLWLEGGTILRRLNEYEYAYKWYSRAWKEDPQNHEILLLIAMNCYDLDRKHEALRFVDKAITLSPDEDQYWAFRGKILEELESYEHAISAYMRASELFPTQGCYFINLASIFNKIGNFDDEKDCLKAGMNLICNDEQAYKNYIREMNEMGLLNDNKEKQLNYIW